MSFDEGVQATNFDATKCKYSAVKMGYWKDNYIQYFVTGYERKTPEINRGYYARTKGVAMFMNKFLKVSKNFFISFHVGVVYSFFLLENWN